MRDRFVDESRGQLWVARSQRRVAVGWVINCCCHGPTVSKLGVSCHRPGRRFTRVILSQWLSGPTVPMPSFPLSTPNDDTRRCGSASKGARKIASGRVAARGPTGNHALMTAFTGDIENIEDFVGYSIREVFDGQDAGRGAFLWVRRC
jgi:hypothetical protein